MTIHHIIIIIPIKTKVIYETATKLHPETTIPRFELLYLSHILQCMHTALLNDAQYISKTNAVKQSKQNCITVSKRRLLELSNVMKLKISSDERKFKKIVSGVCMYRLHLTFEQRFMRFAWGFTFNRVCLLHCACVRACLILIYIHTYM